MQIPEKEPEKAKVYDALIELNRMVAEAIQGKVHSLFPLRKLTTLAFAESVRDALATIDDSVAGVKKTLAMLLGCEQQQLKQQQHANILPALTAVGDVWTIVLGADLAGPYLGRNMASALGIWATAASLSPTPVLAPASTSPSYLRHASESQPKASHDVRYDDAPGLLHT